VQNLSVYEGSPTYLQPSWCVRKQSQKNIVFLSKKVVKNSRMMNVVSLGMTRCLTSNPGHPPNIVFLGKRRRGNIVFLSKNYCVLR
jgi:hypothetical protein